MQARQIRETQGRGLFRAWLTKEKLSQTDAASRLGVHRNLVFRWCEGSRRPSLDMAVALERVTNGAVPAWSWADPDEVEKVASYAERRAATG